MNKVIFTVSILISLSAGYFAGKNDRPLAVKEDLGEVTEPISLRLPELVQPSPARFSENNFRDSAGNTATT